MSKKIIYGWSLEQFNTYYQPPFARLLSTNSSTEETIKAYLGYLALRFDYKFKSPVASLYEKFILRCLPPKQTEDLMEEDENRIYQLLSLTGLCQKNLRKMFTDSYVNQSYRKSVRH